MAYFFGALEGKDHEFESRRVHPTGFELVTSTFGGQTGRAITLLLLYDAIYEVWLRPVYENDCLGKPDSPIDGVSHIGYMVISY